MGTAIGVIQRILLFTGVALVLAVTAKLIGLTTSITEIGLVSIIIAYAIIFFYGKIKNNLANMEKQEDR